MQSCKTISASQKKIRQKCQIFALAKKFLANFGFGKPKID